MTADLTLRIVHVDGSTDELEILSADELGQSGTPSLSSVETERRLTPRPDQPVGQASATVYADAWADVKPSLDNINDLFYIDESGSSTPAFGGRLRDTQSQDEVVTVMLHGPKRDALDAQPSGGNDVYQPQSDASILNNQILPRMSTVSGGTIVEQTASIPFSEAQASPGKSTTKLAEATGAEVEYSPTGSPWELNYVSRLGADRTDETLSPSTGTLLAEPRIRNKVREQVTHVRVLGSQSGTAQVVGEAVTASFDESTDRAVYRNHTDKDIQQQSRADALAQELVNEYDGEPEFIEIEAEIAGSVEPSLGDSFRVSVPSENIDHDLRIMNLRRILDRAGERFRAVLSNRKLTRQKQGEEQTRSVDEFREGNAGQYFFNSDGRSFDPVENGEPREITIPYPDNVIGDLGAKLMIKSTSYRGRVVSSGHTHSVTIPNHDHTVSIGDHDHSVSIGNHSHDVTLSDHNHSVSILDHNHDVTIVIPHHVHNFDEAEGAFFENAATFVNTQNPPEDHDHTYEKPARTGGLYSAETETQTSDDGGATTTTTSDGGGTTTTTSNGGATTTTTSNGGGTTTTTNDGGGTTESTDEQSDLVPGINTFSNEQVSNVSVELNGEVVASGLGAPIDEEIDITGKLSGGDNTVTVTTDSLGEVSVAWSFEGIKNAEG
jgi:hypothetical protein